MAEKRMFAKSIVLSDVFLDMPVSARCLYFTLGMLADDDGFVGSPKAIMRQCGASQDDMAILISRRYVLAFDTGVIVIKHWRINNFLRQDRHVTTTYIEELSSLSTDDKGAYIEKNLPPSEDALVDQWLTNGQPNDNQRLTAGQPSIDKGSKEEISRDKGLTSSNELVLRTADVRRILNAWNSIGLYTVKKITEGTNRYTWLRKRIREYGVDGILEAIEKVRQSSFLQGHNRKGWTATFDWFIRPNNFPKVLSGNYDDRATPTGTMKTYNSEEIEDMSSFDVQDVD